MGGVILTGVEQGSGIGIAEETGAGPEAFHFTRNGIGLGIVYHLKFVLDIAQEAISVAKEFELLGIDQ